jgi:hypothetical protein
VPSPTCGAGVITMTEPHALTDPHAMTEPHAPVVRAAASGAYFPLSKSIAL